MTFHEILAQVLDLIIAKAVEMLECEAGSILLCNQEENCLMFSASTSADSKTLAQIHIPLTRRRRPFGPPPQGPHAATPGPRRPQQACRAN